VNQRTKLILLLCLLSGKFSFSQYILNGSAQQISCNCYTLTPATQTQSGSVWNANKISLNNPFDFWFNVFLGCNDNGADGIVFILQPISTSIGSTGEGMGFGGVTPSIGIALDTYQNSNLNDPVFDHISIQSNGDLNHANDLAGPVAISSLSDNVEDCQWHRLRISWDPAAKWLRAYFDGVLRVEKQVDLISTIFNNAPEVYWGFTGATGGEVYVQQFCTALNPVITTNLTIDTACAGSTIQFGSQSESFAPIVSYNWDFGDGSNSTLINPPPHLYATPGIYAVNLKIKGLDGCENDSTKNILIASRPSAALSIPDTCFSSSPRIIFQSDNYGVNYQWMVDGMFVSNDSQPLLNDLSAGSHTAELIVASPYNCGPPATANVNFFIKPLPQVDAVAADGCIDLPIHFEGHQLDNETTITQWNWDLGDSSSSSLQNIPHSYAQPGAYGIKLWANASNGCTSDTVKKIIHINSAFAFAGNDTVVVRNLPFPMHGTGNSNDFQWWPAVGLSDANIADPIATLTAYQDYVLTVTTPEGCIAKDTIHIKAIDGPMIYVPSVFTPNADGLNDRLHPIYVGILQLEKFAVYNRWGQLVFSTSDTKKGWDGSVGGKKAATGTYVWIATARNYLNQPLILKGTTTIIR
jgi:gliding motility-associated-like protein